MRSVARLVLAVVLVLALPTAALAAPPPLTITGQPSPIALLQASTNDLYVFGVVRCNRSVTVDVFANVAQPDDQSATADRSKSINVPCGPRPTFWLIRLQPGDGTGLYTPGPAQLNWHYAAEDQIFGAPQPLVIFPF